MPPRVRRRETQESVPPRRQSQRLGDKRSRPEASAEQVDEGLSSPKRSELEQEKTSLPESQQSESSSSGSEVEYCDCEAGETSASDDECLVEMVRQFDQDEEYARQLQEEEYNAAFHDTRILQQQLLLGLGRPGALAGLDLFRRAASMDLGSIITGGYRIVSESSASDQEQHDFAHELEDSDRPRYHRVAERPTSGSDDDSDDDNHEIHQFEHYHSDDEYGLHFGDDDDQDEDDDDEEYYDEDEVIRRYRAALAARNMVPSALQLFEFLDQMRFRRLNAVGPFIADEDFDSSYEALLTLSERIGEVKKRGLSEDGVSKLKLAKWTGTPRRLEDRTKEHDCPICLEAYVKDEKLMALDCSHRFHWECSRRWLLERATCPVCRLEVHPPDTK